MRTLPIPALLVFAGLAGCGSDTKIDRVNKEPVVHVTAPEEGALFRQGELIVATGDVADTFDDPPALEVTWQLDEAEATPAEVDAEGNTSLNLDTAALSVGEHRLTLTAVDSDGAPASAFVTFDVAGPLGPPLVEITAPDDGLVVLPGTSITFTGMASDTTTPADDLDFDWSSSLDGELLGAISGDGQSALLIDTLTIGVHTITLTATDGDGEIGQDSITVTVEEEPDPVEPEPGDLIFSEVMVNPNQAADEDGEWVELYNTSGSTLDIQGYSFHDDGADYWIFDTSITVEPHGFIVLCANPNPSVNGGVPCDGWFYRNPMGEMPPADRGHGSGVAIANNDDELELTSPDGVDIDVFDYNDTDSDPIEPGMSFGLDPKKMDGVLNDDAANWCVGTTVLHGMTDVGTPGQANDPCP